MVTVFAYSGCDTCRRALRWLREQDIPHEVVPVRERPPTRPQLQRLLQAVGGDRRRLFNTSGRDYRELGLSARLPELSETQALDLIAGNGNLLKRPAVLAPQGALVGFQPAAWASFFGSETPAAAR